MAAVEGATSPGDLRVARLAATEDVADEPLGTGRLVLTATGDTPHPGLTRPLRGVIHEASLLLGAGRLLAVLPVELRADRGALSNLDAALPLGARAAFTGGETGSPIGTFLAEEALGTARGFIHPAGTATPPLTDESLLAPLTRRLWQGVAGFALLSHPHQRAQAKRGALAPERQRAAGEPLRALRIRHARAVGAVALPPSRVEEARKRRLAVLGSLARTLVGQQAPAFLKREHWNCPRLWSTRALARRHRMEQPGQWDWKQQPKKHGQ